MDFFVGIDPSLTNTAVVVLDQRGEAVAWSNSKHRKDKARRTDAGFELRRLREIADHVLETIRQGVGEDYGRVNVAYENYSFESLNRPYTLGELGGVLKLSLFEAGYEIDLVEPKRLKKFAVWNGAAGKDAMMEKARLEWPGLAKLAKKVVTDDLCDAWFLACYAWYRHAPKDVVRYVKDKTLLRRRLELCKTSMS